MVFSCHADRQTADLRGSAASLGSTSFQQLTKCSLLDADFAHSQSLYFQSITNCQFYKSFVLIFIRNAGGVGGASATSHEPRLLSPASISFRINTCRTESKQTTLSTFRINTYEKTGGGVGPTFQLSNPKPANVPALFQLRTIHWPLTVVSYSPLIARHAKATPLQSTPCPKATSKPPSRLPRKPARSSWKNFPARSTFATKATKWTSSPRPTSAPSTPSSPASTNTSPATPSPPRKAPVRRPLPNFAGTSILSTAPRISLTATPASAFPLLWRSVTRSWPPWSSILSTMNFTPPPAAKAPPSTARKSPSPKSLRSRPACFAPAFPCAIASSARIFSITANSPSVLTAFAATVPPRSISLVLPPAASTASGNSASTSGTLPRAFSSFKKPVAKSPTFKEIPISSAVLSSSPPTASFTKKCAPQLLKSTAVLRRPALGLSEAEIFSSL